MWKCHMYIAKQAWRWTSIIALLSSEGLQQVIWKEKKGILIKRNMLWGFIFQRMKVVQNLNKICFWQISEKKGTIQWSKTETQTIFAHLEFLNCIQFCTFIKNANLYNLNKIWTHHICVSRFAFWGNFVCLDLQFEENLDEQKLLVVSVSDC